MLHPSQGLKLHSTVELTSSVVQFHFKSCHAVKISLQILSEIALFFFFQDSDVPIFNSFLKYLHLF
jgi:hypothetical protein